MNAAPSPAHQLRPALLDRRARLQAAARSLSPTYVHDLLAEVDAALARIETGAFGLCETCGDPIESERLENNPLVRFCLDHLTPREARAHEQDLALATQIQARLLPAAEIATAHWQTHYCYHPAGVVGGDYCEVVPSPDGRSLFFAVGDIAGKGVAASLLMTHLSAILRSLLSLDLPLADLIARANRLFCESTPAAHYATLVAGRATESGIDLCNAGHCPPLLLSNGAAKRVEATGLPIGLFCSGRYEVRSLSLNPGDSLVLYSDGITEAQDLQDRVYDEANLIASLCRRAHLDAGEVVTGVLDDVAAFRAAAPQQDDMTLLLVRRR